MCVSFARATESIIMIVYVVRIFSSEDMHWANERFFTVAILDDTSKEKTNKMLSKKILAQL